MSRRAGWNSSFFVVPLFILIMTLFSGAQGFSSMLCRQGGRHSTRVAFVRRKTSSRVAAPRLFSSSKNYDSESQSEPDRQRILMESILTRAERTLATRMKYTDKENNQNADSVLLQTTLRETLQEIKKEILESPPSEYITASSNGDEPFLGKDSTTTTTTTIHPKIQPTGPEDVFRNYGSNPTITSTALAHHLWRHVLRPGVDSAIDATAGNGGDARVLAELLWSQQNAKSSPKKNQSRLVAVDIQETACQNTQRELEKVVPVEWIQMETRTEGSLEVNDDSITTLSSSPMIQIVHGSHDPLPLPHDFDLARKDDDNAIAIALVVYNLGYLPNSSKEYLTQTSSTLRSLQQAVRVLRRGGLLSVMTYPRSNRQEDWAVHVFLEGLALFSSVQQDWQEFVTTVECPASVDDDTRELVRSVLMDLWQERCEMPRQQRFTWRVHEHKKLGWTDAPILLTAVRIK